MPKKPSSADPENCGTCRYFLANPHDQYGYCRRLPPTASIQDGAAVTLWPVVNTSIWCGEFGRILNS